MSLEAGLDVRVSKSAASEWARCKGDGIAGVATAAILLREGEETEWVRCFILFTLASDGDDAYSREECRDCERGMRRACAASQRWKLGISPLDSRDYYGGGREDKKLTQPAWKTRRQRGRRQRR